MTCSHRQAEFAREPKHRWRHGWWILPAAILGSFVWASVIRWMFEAFWGVK